MTSREVTLVARLHVKPNGELDLCSPTVGFYRASVRSGSVIQAGSLLGHIEVLGRLHPLVAPDDAEGVVIDDVATLHHMHAKSKEPLAYDETLLVVDPKGIGTQTRAHKAATAAASQSSGLALKAPSSGRYYGRPGPGKEAFVKVGDTLTQGQTVALLEVMKTFNRVLYGGAGLPERARVKAIVPAEESDVQSGSVLIELEPA